MLVSRYAHVEKNGDVFHPLRAAGLAVELAHKLARDVGFGAVDRDSLSRVTVSGPRVRVYTSARWRKVAANSSLMLKVLPAEATLSYSVFKEQREWLADMGLNIWQVDPPIARRGVKSPDLLVDVGPTSFLEVAGRMPVELKVHSSSNLEQRIQEDKEEFVLNYVKLESIFEGIGAGLLLVSPAEETGDGWKPLRLRTFLWQDDTWQELGVPKKGAGPHRHRIANKRPLLDVFDDMTWYERRGGGDDIGMVAHFLEALGLDKNHVGQRVSAWKAAFPRRGPEKLDLKHVSIRRGWDKCWVGTRAAFRQVHRYL
jgi:hypothetical protein